MVKAWYMDNDKTDPRAEHQRNPPEFISIEELHKKTGVELFKLDLKTYESEGVLEKIKKDRGYTYEDEITISKECLPDYDEKLKSFFTEHLHADEEIRLVTEGSGYFDIRDGLDEWIRIKVTPGDLIIIPRGSYHRFTLDNNNYLRARRLYEDEPGWLTHIRPADDMACRKKYVEQQKRGFSSEN
ncbi:1,2-dihydroxy-3-keto-5-methylthiopentene dioxygenase [Papilio machaon]|uniref:1,2-dihydroxy-3-keto-5-methylthiopentene dioxygenase n=1 Tax=Papilio machaon TaxID=76193 RepID=UPI001E6654CD|nr:1,2-dihydroxy-3-keto-5-methylthiopentene dioxygenase [Papilio machaon]